EILRGELRDQFVVDVYQAGAGTSHNMNANEVIANRAAELLGEPRGRYTRVHPNDHVNMGQSTNDVFPTATRLALLLVAPDLLRAGRELAKSLDIKRREFAHVLKTGRTHLQDAVPITLGQEFSGYAACIAAGCADVEHATGGLKELNLGATAVGTGINAGTDFVDAAIARLRRYTRIDVRAAANRFRVTQSMGDVVSYSGAVRRLAIELAKVASDLRLLSMGPRAGIAEIQLPPVQPGSSIMPGKVNPSIAEMVNQVCFQVRGCDETIAGAAEAGQLELNVMMPVIAWNALHETTILARAMDVLRTRCVDGIRADEARARELLDRSTAVATALSPYIGYAATAEIAKESVKTGRSIREIVEERRLLDPGALDRILSPEEMTTPGIPGGGPTGKDAREKTSHGAAGSRGARRRSGDGRTARDRAAERRNHPAARSAVSARGSRAARGARSRRMAEARADHGRARDRRRRHRR
ncbi:MAG TPA: aspartate ammonia-lyase, partial [Gemmatimonadaceae bacterium]|nr:aspartate ammonia-lyase [Gemmatimonadaceae bacterium]